MFVFACRDCSFFTKCDRRFFTEMELIQTEDMANTETAILKAKTKRNTYVQTWRRSKKFEKRQAVFMQEYVEAKYQAINDEVTKFYNSLNVLHPTKHDLRKTKEFREWKKAISGKPAKKSSSAKKTQHNSGPAATNQNSQRNSGPEATNQDSQDNSGPEATNQDSQHNSGPAATNQDTQDNQESTATTVEVLPPLQVTDQCISQILQDLRNDPDLNTIFNEIEIEMQDDDVFW